MAGPTTTNTPVLSPDGREATLPSDQVATALTQGWTVLTPELRSSRASAEKYGTGLGPAKAFGAEAVRTAAPFGIGAKGLEALGVSKADQLGYQRENPVSSFAGGLTGAVAPVAASALVGAPEAGAAAAGEEMVGGAGAGLSMADAAGMGPGVFGKAADLTARGATAMLPESIGTGTLGKIVTGGVERLAKGATEGALYSASNYVDQSILQNHPMTAEHLLAEAGTGALYGGVLAGGLSAVGLGVSAGTRAEMNTVFERRTGLDLADVSKHFGLTSAETKGLVNDYFAKGEASGQTAQELIRAGSEIDPMAVNDTAANKIHEAINGSGLNVVHDPASLPVWFGEAIKSPRAYIPGNPLHDAVGTFLEQFPKMVADQDPEGAIKALTRDAWTEGLSRHLLDPAFDSGGMLEKHLQGIHATPAEEKGYLNLSSWRQKLGFLYGLASGHPLAAMTGIAVDKAMLSPAVIGAKDAAIRAIARFSGMPADVALSAAFLGPTMREQYGAPRGAVLPGNNFGQAEAPASKAAVEGADTPFRDLPREPNMFPEGNRNRGYGDPFYKQPRVREGFGNQPVYPENDPIHSASKADQERGFADRAQLSPELKEMIAREMELKRGGRTVDVAANHWGDVHANTPDAQFLEHARETHTATLGRIMEAENPVKAAKQWLDVKGIDAGSPDAKAFLDNVRTLKVARPSAPPQTPANSVYGFLGASTGNLAHEALRTDGHQPDKVFKLANDVVRGLNRSEARLNDAVHSAATGAAAGAAAQDRKAPPAKLTIPANPTAKQIDAVRGELATIAKGIIHDGHPDLADATQRVVTELQNHLPAPPIQQQQGNVPGVDRDWHPAAKNVQAYREVLAALADPIGTIAMLSTGRVSKEAQGSLRRAFPELMGKATSKLAAELTSTKERIPYARRQMLESFIGSTRDRALSPDVVLAAQKAITAPVPGPDQQQMTGKGSQAAENRANSMRTATQRGTP